MCSPMMALVSVEDINGQQIRVGSKAPRSVEILRGELQTAIDTTEFASRPLRLAKH